MPDTRDSAEWRRPHWAGTTAQLAEAAQLAMNKVRALVPYPDGYDPDGPADQHDRLKYRAWLAAEDAHGVAVSLQEKDGYSSKLADLEALAQVPERSLATIESIVVTLGHGIYSVPSVTFRVTRDSGLSVTIFGYERTWTAGLRHQLDEVLEPAQRIQAPLMSNGVRVWFASTVIFNVVFYTSIAILKAATDWGRPPRTVVEVGIATVIMLAIAALWWASSLKLELLGPGQQPRYQRWRGKLLGAVATLILGVIAAVIYGIFG